MWAPQASLYHINDVLKPYLCGQEGWLLMPYSQSLKSFKEIQQERIPGVHRSKFSATRTRLFSHQADVEDLSLRAVKWLHLAVH